jgi:hypothetical protein
MNDPRFSSGYMRYVDDATLYTFSSDVGGMSLLFAAHVSVK